MLAARLRKVDVRGAVDITRLLTGSIADLLDRYFESDAVRGVLSVSGVIGTWAGPRSAGTAYVMLHHHIGEADGQAGAWGFPRGGMERSRRRWPQRRGHLAPRCGRAPRWRGYVRVTVS